MLGSVTSDPLMVTMVTMKINKNSKSVLSELLPPFICFLKLFDFIPEQGCYMSKPKWSALKKKIPLSTHICLGAKL